MNKLSRDELIDLVRIIGLGEGDDDEFNNWIVQINQSVPHPEALTVIMGSKEDISAERIVDKLLSYKPIVLP